MMFDLYIQIEKLHHIIKLEDPTYRFRLILFYFRINILLKEQLFFFK